MEHNGDCNYLIKNEANVVRDQIWDENASIGKVTDTFEELESRVDESKYGYNEAVPTWRQQTE